MERTAMSKGLRFAVLSRDGHTCQYCGRKPPEVKLAVDHVVPVSAGGTNQPDNLVAACVDCNAGKGTKMSLLPVDNGALAARLQAFKERRKILRATLKAERDLERTQTERAWIVASAWNKAFQHTPEPGKKESIDSRFFAAILNYLIVLPVEVLLSMVHNCETKWRGGYLDSETGAMKYFCGAMSNRRREREPAL